ncbi:MAG: HAD-IA family hydrolase [Ruminococcus sp.]|nr:HAD-IA family hydrolase [Ruminococcus sp.]
MKKIVIFDLDGTLVNSIYDLADCTNKALSMWNLPQNSLKEYYTFVGNGMENLIRTAMRDKGTDDELYRVVRRDFDSLYAEHCNDKTVPYEGIAELLKSLADKGIDTAVLSNKAQMYVPSVLHKAFPHHEFSLAWGQQEGIKRKPHGEGIEKLLETLGFTKDECVYIGDSDVDVITARNAGVDMIGVLWGFREKEELLENGAPYIAETPEELFEIITSI